MCHRLNPWGLFSANGIQRLREKKKII